MKDIPQLTESSIQKPRLPLPTASAATKDEPSAKQLLRAKLMPLRLGIWSFIFLAVGMILGYVILPLLPTDVSSQLLAAHLPEEGTSFHQVFLRLCVSCIPAGLLLSASGLTGFSKTVISLVLGLRGLSDGMAMAMLCLLTVGHLTVDKVYPFPWLLAAIGGWVLVRLVSRWLLAVSAHRTATEYYRISADQAHAARARPLVTKHLAVTLCCFLMVTLACLGYGYALFLIV